MSAQPIEGPAPQAVLARRPFLRLVRNPARPARRLPFVLLVVALLGVALVGLLVLNTQRAQLSFSATALQAQVASLQDQQQQLERQVESDQDPATLASRAAALGMVPELQPGFVDASGKVVGAVPSGAPVPAANAPVQGGVVVAGSGAAVAPRPAATPSPTPAAKATAPARKATATKAPAGASTRPTPQATPSSRSSR